jgi:hypothetical protein
MVKIFKWLIILVIWTITLILVTASTKKTNSLDSLDPVLNEGLLKNKELIKPAGRVKPMRL